MFVGGASGGVGERLHCRFLVCSSIRESRRRSAYPLVSARSSLRSMELYCTFARPQSQIEQNARYYPRTAATSTPLIAHLAGSWLFSPALLELYGDSRCATY